jgi:hypothetical protein
MRAAGIDYLRPRLVVSSELAEQNQDQHDNEYETKPAAAVVAGSVKRATTEPAKSTE